MAIVTISREFGSEGNYIGTKVAEALGYHFVFKKEIHDVFERYCDLSCFEKKHYSEMNDSFWSQFEEMKREAVDLLSEVIRALACHGNLVIIGRCGYAILGDLTDVLNVRIRAPLSTKIDRIMKEKIVAPNEVKHIVNEEDKKRANILNLFYGIQWDRTSVFDMVINTGKVPPDLAARVIVETVKGLEDRKKYEEPSTRTLTIDPTLSRVVSEVLGP
jgi:cytidylate kinase